jgi:adenine-specific DNA-methyltransferase
MLVYKNTVPDEYKEILNGQKVPCINFQDNYDVLGVEGDNLQSLISLTCKYKNSIKLIYADVPYNTGNNDFLYNDVFNKTDSINFHSDWISWMLPRLIVVRELLSGEGVMVISIDHNEKRNLENLCVEVFGEKNVLTTATVVSNRGGGGRRNKKDLVTTNEYLIICAKNIDSMVFGEGVFNEDKTKDKKPRGIVPSMAKLIYNRQNQFYPFLVNKKSGEVTTIPLNEYNELNTLVKAVCVGYGTVKEYDDYLHTTINEYVQNIINKYQNDYNVIFPMYDGKWGRWVPAHGTILNGVEPYDILFEKNGVIKYWETVKDYRPMKTIMDKKSYTNSNATSVLKELYGKKNFDTPKSIVLMRDIITAFTNNGDTVLDWCAGSNSTYHGLVEADKLQGYERKYIFIQKEEKGNNIFRDHSMKRVKVVNDIEVLDKNIIESKTKIIGVDEYYLNCNVDYDKDLFIKNLDSLNNIYKSKVNKFDKIYKYS